MVKDAMYKGMRAGDEKLIDNKYWPNSTE